MNSKGFNIRVEEDQTVKLEPINMTTDDFIILAGSAFQIALQSAYNAYKESHPGIDEATDKELRGALYDRMILITSEIAQDLYPEYLELYSKTPEAMLEALDQKIQELKKLEDNQQETN